MSLALSIIIPVYNCEKTIRKCLDSIFIQKNDLKYEIIIVDDGSSDGTVEVVESVIAGRGNVKFIHQENAGAGAARNKALRYASGDYLLFIDGDDYISSNSLNILKIEMQKNEDLDVLIFRTGFFPLRSARSFTNVSLIHGTSFFGALLWKKIISHFLKP